MRRVLIIVAVLSLFNVPLATYAAPSSSSVVSSTVVAIVGHDPHPFLSRENASARSRTSVSNLQYHGGPVVTSPVSVVPIYWGSSINTLLTFLSDERTGIENFYTGYNNSLVYTPIQTQYTQTVSKAVTSVTNSTSLGTPLIDSSTASSNATQVLNEVVNEVGFSGLSESGYYPVYTDLNRNGAGYCAWHSYGSVSSGGTTKVIKFAFFFSLINDSGCDISNGSVGLSTTTQSLVNVSAHELSEMLTDPTLTAWYDSSGQENGDKCAWQFNGVQTLSVLYNFQLQGEWNNATRRCAWTNTSG